MSEQKQILEQYLKAKLSNKKSVSILRLEKIADGWESDNNILTVEYGEVQRTREDWVWRIYLGAGSREKAILEFNSMQKLFAAGYPVPRVFLLEADHSPIDRPFIIMEYIPGKEMWQLLDTSSTEKRESLLDQFCQLYVRLHNMDWKPFDGSLPHNEPFFYIDRWLDEAHDVTQNFPDFGVSTFLEWVIERRDLFACEQPSPVHQDFHPANILVREDDCIVVIDWAHFAVTDFRFDLSWTLILAHAYGWTEMRDQILRGYEYHFGRSVKQIEAFEAIACARRLFDITISLTLGPQRLGMTAQAVESMRANMEAHRRVNRLFIERTGLQIKAFDELFGKKEGLHR